MLYLMYGCDVWIELSDNVPGKPYRLEIPCLNYVEYFEDNREAKRVARLELSYEFEYD